MGDLLLTNTIRLKIKETKVITKQNKFKNREITEK